MTGADLSLNLYSPIVDQEPPFKLSPCSRRRWGRGWMSPVHLSSLTVERRNQSCFCSYLSFLSVTHTPWHEIHPQRVLVMVAGHWVCTWCSLVHRLRGWTSLVTARIQLRVVASALPTLYIMLSALYKRLFASSEAVTICLYSRDGFFTAQ